MTYIEDEILDIDIDPVSELVLDIMDIIEVKSLEVEDVNLRDLVLDLEDLACHRHRG